MFFFKATKISEFSNVVGQQVNKRKSTLFWCVHNKELKNKEKTPFTIASKNKIFKDKYNKICIKTVQWKLQKLRRNIIESLKAWRWNMIPDWSVDIIKILILPICNAGVIPIKILERTLQKYESKTYRNVKDLDYSKPFWRTKLEDISWAQILLFVTSTV